MKITTSAATATLHRVVVDADLGYAHTRVAIDLDVTDAPACARAVVAQQVAIAWAQALTGGTPMYPGCLLTLRQAMPPTKGFEETAGAEEPLVFFSAVVRRLELVA